MYPRTLKSVVITEEMRSALSVDKSTEALTPAELIKACLKAPIDLLWNGGIGTYIKASTENNAEVGDRANDAIRVDGAGRFSSPASSAARSIRPRFRVASQSYLE